MSRNFVSSVKYDLHQNIKPRIAPLTVAVTGALAATSLQAATITVTTLNDGFTSNGQCELRAALVAATQDAAFGDCPAGDPGTDTIVFAPGLSGTIQLDAANAVAGFEEGADNSSLAIGDSVEIDGDNRITVRGTGGGSVFRTKYDTDAFPVESLSLSNITITNGGGDDFGGGIYSTARNMTLSNTTVTNNRALVSGAGVHHAPYYASGYDKSLFLFDSTISSNTVSGIGAGGGGGGVYADMGFGGTVFIDGTTFDGNSSLRGNGGGVSLNSNDYSSLTVKYSEFTDNESKYADGAGGGAFVDMAYLTASIYDNTFSGNVSNGDGGGLYLTETISGFQQAEVTMNDNQFINNQAQNLGGGAFIQVLNGGTGTLENPVKFVNINDSLFQLNESDGSAAGLRLDLGDIVTSTITGSTVSLNTSQSGNGGGALVSALDTQVYVFDTRVKYNTTYAGGGGGMQIDAPGSTFGMEYSAFLSNDAQGGPGGGFRLAGAVAELGISTSAFRNNSASASGGGLSLPVGSLENSIVEFKYNEVSGNTSGLNGGGIFASIGAGSTLFLKNSTISGNDAAGLGGGAALFGDMTTEVKYSTIANNTSVGEGGGLNNAAATCRVSDSILAGNTGNGKENQELSGSTLCDVTDSLIAGSKYSDFNDISGNILNQDPNLQPLADNGGPTFTHALLPDSPAVDAGTAGANVPDTDQRGPGFPRVVGGGLDMGAFELRVDGLFSDRFEQTPP
jgi:hypothetical protein